MKVRWLREPVSEILLHAVGSVVHVMKEVGFQFEDQGVSPGEEVLFVDDSVLEGRWEASEG